MSRKLAVKWAATLLTCGLFAVGSFGFHADFGWPVWETWVTIMLVMLFRREWMDER